MTSRLVVVALGLPLVLGLVWLGGWWLAALAAAGGLIALHEFYAMTRPLRPVVLAGYLGFVAILLAARLGGFEWLAGGVFSTFALAFLLKGVADTRSSTTVSVGATVFGAAWIGLGLACVLLLRDIPEHGRLASFTVLLAVFAGDTLAFLAGRLFGRHKLAPAISPGKTWEGFLAGAAATVFVTWIALYKSSYVDGGRSLLLGVVLALAAPLGDLFESLVKRDMNVKDSGRLLGGHGGVLDRLDAILFASVAAFFLLDAIGKT